MERDQEFVFLLEILSQHVPTAHLESGAAIRDAIDFSQWLNEIASAIEQNGLKETVRELANKREQALAAPYGNGGKVA
jgi:hypothetical protein